MQLDLGPHIHKSEPLGDGPRRGFRSLAAALRFYHAFAAEHGLRMGAGQFFASETRAADAPLLVEGSAAAAELAAAARELQTPLVIHTPYLHVMFGAARTKRVAQSALRRELSLAASLVPPGGGGSVCRGVVVHLQDLPPAAIVADLRALVDSFAAYRLPVPDSTLFLENEVRRNAEWGYSTPRQLGELCRAVLAARLPLRVGLCVDTAHLWISGTDLRTGAHAAAFFADMEAEVGRPPALPLMVHLNDAPRPLGQGRDAHAPLGLGHIWGQPRTEESAGALRLALEWAERAGAMVMLERTGRFEFPDGERSLTRELANDFRELEGMGVNKAQGDA